MVKSVSADAAPTLVCRPLPPGAERTGGYFDFGGSVFVSAGLFSQTLCNFCNAIFSFGDSCKALQGKQITELSCGTIDTLAVSLLL